MIRILGAMLCFAFAGVGFILFAMSWYGAAILFATDLLATQIGLLAAYCVTIA